MIPYLKLPLNFGKVLEGDRLDICDLKNSIARNLHLIITTVQGECKHDDHYGSLFLDFDYDIHLSNDARRELVIQSLKEQVNNYEKRLTNVSIQVNVKQETVNSSNGRIQRRRVEMVIAGIISRNLEPFYFQTGFFIGPVDFD